MARKRIGELLIQEGEITLEQLEAALRRQVVHGGRLGTNLVELHDLDLDVIAIALGRQHHLPPARQKHFDRVDPELQAQLPVELAARWHAVPIGRVSGEGRIAIAATDPLPEQALAELTEALGAEVMVAIAGELRVFYYLERRYGLSRPTRFIRPPTQVPAATPEGEPPPEPVEPPPEPPPSGERRRFLRVVTDSGVEPQSDAVLGRIQLAQAPVDLGGERVLVADPSSHDNVLRAIRQATGRDLIGELVVELMREGFDHGFDAGLFLVIREQVAVVWKGFVRGVDRQLVESLAIPLGMPSAIAEAWHHRAPYLGPPLPGALVETRLAEQLGRPAAEVVVVPLDLAGEVVGLLYGQSQMPGRAEACTEQLLELGKGVSAAFERLVRAAQR